MLQPCDACADVPMTYSVIVQCTISRVRVSVRVRIRVRASDRVRVKVSDSIYAVWGHANNRGDPRLI